jgi:glycosyltransferase involved in cell wall biosynthesis
MISAIIPARNEEASIARAVESVAAQSEVGEVIVVNDQSTDGTASILRELCQHIPKLKIIDVHGLPEGWVGKNHAVWLGAAAAQGQWLLFTDADTFHLPGSARRALSDAGWRGAGMVSYSPEQELESFWERALVPVVYWRLSQRYSFERVNDERAPDAAANGQYLMIRKDAYAAVGGHGAIKGEILEDVALAREVKHAGYRIYFAPGQGIVRTRMYRSFEAMWQGWTKNLYPLFGGKLVDILMEIDDASPWMGVLLALVAGFWRYGKVDWVLWTAALALFARPWVRCGLWLRRNHYRGAYIQYFLPGVAVYAAALVASWWKNTRGAVEWKGRTYPGRA